MGMIGFLIFAAVAWTGSKVAQVADELTAIRKAMEASKAKAGKPAMEANEAKGTSSLTEKAKRWLKETGYPLEMSAMRALRNAGFRDDRDEVGERGHCVIPSHYYFDKSTDKHREVDLVGVASRGAGKAQFIAQVVVECKFSAVPWIAFVEEHGASRISPDQVSVLHRPASQSAIVTRAFLAGQHDLLQSELFRIPQVVGYGLVAMSKKDGNQDQAYQSLHQVCAASDAVVAEHDDDSLATISVPVVVLRGRLMTARLAEEDLELDEVDDLVIEWRSPGRTSLRYVKVMTEAAFEAKAPDIFESAVLCAEKGHQHLVRHAART